MLWRSPAPARRPEGFIEPCLPTLGHGVPTGLQWAYEIKHDGFRFICWRDSDHVRVFSPSDGGRAPIAAVWLLDHRDHLNLNHCLWLSETADLDRRAGRTGYPEIAHAHVGALGERLVVRDEGVGLDNIGPSRASGLEAGVEVLKGLFDLRPHVARADDVALCVTCQLAGDVDGLTRVCDRNDVRIGGLPLPHADVHARRLDSIDLHGHNSSPQHMFISAEDAAAIPASQTPARPADDARRQARRTPAQANARIDRWPPLTAPGRMKRNQMEWLAAL